MTTAWTPDDRRLLSVVAGALDGPLGAAAFAAYQTAAAGWDDPLSGLIGLLGGRTWRG